MIKILSQIHILDVEYFLHIGSGEYVEAVGDGTMGDSCDVSVSSLLTAAFYIHLFWGSPRITISPQEGICR
jgi:hypothetical protein